MPRPDGRSPHQLRPIKMTRHFIQSAPGAVLIEMGRTKVLCTATIQHDVPPFLAGTARGWLTAEYGMLPASTPGRKARERGGKTDGRTAEIQRLIGRSMRAITDLEILGERTLWIDCDVLQADGGTRTAAITGAYVALTDALNKLKEEGLTFPAPVIKQAIAAVSVGLVHGTPVLDLCYEEDSRAAVDMNVVMTSGGEFVEVQGTAEGRPFSRERLNELLSLAERGIRELLEIQQTLLKQP